MRSTPAIFLVACLVLGGLTACNGGGGSCVPDGSPACECTPQDNRSCSDTAGRAGLQVCRQTGQWGMCAAFGDGGTDDTRVGSDAAIPEL